MNGLTYPKRAGETAVDVYGQGANRKISPYVKGGPGTAGGYGSGTGAKRYPKGAAVSLDSGRLNPRNLATKTTYVGGI